MDRAIADLINGRDMEFRIGKIYWDKYLQLEHSGQPLTAAQKVERDTALAAVLNRPSDDN
jgi:hypothetical protein